MPDEQSLRDAVNELPWFHKMDLGQGVVTPGVAECSRILPRLHLPQSLQGKTVLDVGAWDGYYSFQAARRGAARVLATDSYSWDGSGWGSKASFELAREALGLSAAIEDQSIDVMDLSPTAVGGTFDVVLLLGVLYHLRDPVTAIERVASVCDELLVLETEIAVNFLPYEAARFHSGSDLNNDGSNWFQFNVRALRGILRESGFTSVDVVYRHPFLRRVARALLELKAGRSFRAVYQSSRVVIHARR